tara:strand:- start:47 stop:319 length:273 start_codon:yes stop_codon:yes gene_type:complete
MANLTVTITETELKALKTVVLDPQEWTENAVKNRSRIAIERICESLLKHCNENSIALAVGQDAQVTQAYTLGLVDEVANVDQNAAISVPE